MTELATAPFETQDQQRHAVRMGIWMFLATEVLFFGAAVTVYAVARATHASEFVAAARDSRLWIGTANSVLLVTSSLVVSLAVKCERRGVRRAVVPLLLAAAALGLAFLGAKGAEYDLDIRDGFWPGGGSGVTSRGGQLYWSLYWLLTGVHAVHLAIGIGALLTLAWLMWRTSPRQETVRIDRLQVAALYWHLVDVVWIFLYPLLYLAGRGP